jgi:hypothetical protein
MSSLGTFALGATLSIPTVSQGEELLTGSAGGTLLARKWDADTYYTTVEGLWAYPVLTGWSALAGFRWIYWQTSYTNSYDITLGSLTDTGDVTINGYVPFVGIMTKRGGFTIGAVGIPTTVGTVEHKESVLGSTNRLVVTGDLSGGYFAEIFAEYGIPAYDAMGVMADFSIFCKVSWLHATSTVTMQDLSTAGGFATPRDFDFILDRNLLFLGAKTTLNFDLSQYTGGLL